MHRREAAGRPSAPPLAGGDKVKRIPYRMGPYEFHLPPDWPPLLHKAAPTGMEPLAPVEVLAIDQRSLVLRGADWGPEVVAVLLLPSVSLRAMRDGGPTWPNSCHLSPRVASLWQLRMGDRLTLTVAQRWVGQVAVLPLKEAQGEDDEQIEKAQ